MRGVLRTFLKIKARLGGGGSRKLGGKLKLFFMYFFVFNRNSLVVLDGDLTVEAKKLLLHKLGCIELPKSAGVVGGNWTIFIGSRTHILYFQGSCKPQLSSQDKGMIICRKLCHLRFRIS